MRVWFICAKMLSLLYLVSVCNLLLKKREEDEEEMVFKKECDLGQHLISVPHNKCTVLNCTAFKFTNRSMQFGTQLMCSKCLVYFLIKKKVSVNSHFRLEITTIRPMW